MHRVSGETLPQADLDVSRADHLLAVYVIEDEKPAVVATQPSGQGRHLYSGLALVLLYQVENRRVAQAGQVLLEAGRRVGDDEEQRCVLFGVAGGYGE